MHILVTGANGFVGAKLVSRLINQPGALAWTRLTLIDLQLPTYDAPRICCLAGNLTDPQLLTAALQVPVDVAFHLAIVPGGAAEKDYELGRKVNLDATLALFELLQQHAKPARVVFASTIAVYGSPLPALVDDNTALCRQSGACGPHSCSVARSEAGFSAAPNVHYQPDPALQATFASYPPLPSPAAQALGLAHDGSLEQLIKRTLEPESEDLPAL